MPFSGVHVVFPNQSIFFYQFSETTSPKQHAKYDWRVTPRNEVHEQVDLPDIISFFDEAQRSNQFRGHSLNTVFEPIYNSS